MVKVSVIIPVYNVENYLRECLSSVINQTLRDIEIICVNDGSTDNSLRILSEYEQLDNRITLIHKSNKGLASTRNFGMKYAKGKYLFFLDSDDYLELNALEELYHFAEENSLDFLIFQAINYDSDKKEFFETEYFSMNKLKEFTNGSVFNYKDLNELIFNISVTAWQKLYNREFIENIGAKFPDGLIFEDNLFFWEVLFNAERVAFLPKYFYIRRIHSKSIMSYADKRFIDSIEVNRLIIEKFRKYGALDKFKHILYDRRFDLTFYRLREIQEEYKELYFEKLREDYQKIVVDGFFEDYMDILCPRAKTIFLNCLNSNSYNDFFNKMNNNSYL